MLQKLGWALFQGAIKLGLTLTYIYNLSLIDLTFTSKIHRTTNKPVHWHYKRSWEMFWQHLCNLCWLQHEVENTCSCSADCHLPLPSVELQLLLADFWYNNAVVVLLTVNYSCTHVKSSKSKEIYSSIVFKALCTGWNDYRLHKFYRTVFTWVLFGPIRGESITNPLSWLTHTHNLPAQVSTFWLVSGITLALVLRSTPNWKLLLKFFIIDQINRDNTGEFQSLLSQKTYPNAA